MLMRRFLNAGFAFADDLSSLADVRSRYSLAGSPTVVDSPRGLAMHFSTGNNILATNSVGYFPHSTDGDFSVAFWIRTEDDSHAVMGNKRIDGDAKGWSVRIGSGEIILKCGDGGGHTEIISDTEINDNAWHHVAFIVDRDGNSYPYIDGVQETGVANFEDGDDISSDLDFAIGCDALGSFDMDGDLREVLVINRLLTEAERVALMQPGRVF